jgi:hypothetical protein
MQRPPDSATGRRRTLRPPGAIRAPGPGANPCRAYLRRQEKIRPRLPPRRKSAPCSSRAPGAASRWCGSRAATRLFSGRGGEEAEALADAGIPFEIVPGVTTPLGIAAYTGVPLTHREHTSVITFVNGYAVGGIDWDKVCTPKRWWSRGTPTGCWLRHRRSWCPRGAIAKDHRADSGGSGGVGDLSRPVRVRRKVAGNERGHCDRRVGRCLLQKTGAGRRQIRGGATARQRKRAGKDVAGSMAVATKGRIHSLPEPSTHRLPSRAVNRNRRIGEPVVSDRKLRSQSKGRLASGMMTGDYSEYGDYGSVDASSCGRRT